LLAPVALFVLPEHGAYAAGPFVSGNLLVSTSVYTDLPSITAGATVLPINSTTFNVSGVATSGSAPNIVATITTSAKNKYVAGQTVVIAGVVGATQVNGTWTIASITSTTKFTINMGSTTVSAYTSGGTTTGDIAIAGNQYPQVFNNAAVDANFGITEPIVLDQIPATTSLVTTPISQTTVPNSDTVAPGGDQLVTSFSSKSELALNQSTDQNFISFMGYDAPTAAIDVSNSNTPSEIDTSNTDTAPGTSGTGYYRDAASMDINGSIQFTESGAYGGNNGRAAILDPGNSTLYLVGNAGNGGTPTQKPVVIGSGSQIATEASTSEAAQDATNPAPTTYGNFNITQTQTGTPVPDKSTKDDNFRGLAQYNGVIYMTKGSGGNGINTVYFVDTTGNACPSGGVGVPQAGASLPSASSWTSSALYPQYNTSNAALGLSTTNPGLSPTNMCILNGFNTGLATPAGGAAYTGPYPFGIWFANPTTMYVADEGSGSGVTTGSAPDTTGGLQKWVLNTSSNTWTYEYTVTSGLNLYTSYPSVATSPAGVNGGPAGQSYPTGSNTLPGGSGKPWTPANDGLRNITGQLNSDGTVTVWGVTSTISGSGDQGADPNEVVAVSDTVSATSLPPAESFSVVMQPTDGVVYRGVSFTPTTQASNMVPEVPWAPLLPISGGVLAGGAYVVLRRRRALSLG
jgi:hypothetical protein